jgi:transcription initiation factor IIE alpha subunit
LPKSIKPVALIVNLRVILYERQTWPLKLREEYRPRMFEKRVLRKIYGTNRDEIKGVRRKLQNEWRYNSFFIYCASLGRLNKGK